MIEKILLKTRNKFRKIIKIIKSPWIKYYDNLPADINYFEGSLYDAIY